MPRLVHVTLLTVGALGATAGSHAQSSLTLYGRVDLSLAQQADAVKLREMRNGSGSRLGSGLKALFEIQHRFNADTGLVTTPRFWDDRSIVSLARAAQRLSSLGESVNETDASAPLIKPRR